MNDYLDQLEQALSDAAVKEYASSPPVPGTRRPLRRAPGVAIVAALLVAAATAAAAIVVLTRHDSAPLTGTVPTLRILHYDVPLTPDIEAGHAGWCSYPSFSITGLPGPESGGGACSPAYSPGTGILLAGGEPLSNNRKLLGASHTPLSRAEGNISLFYAVVTRQVAAIRLRRGLVIAARSDSRLPRGWRAVITFVSGQIDPVGLDRAGRVIRETGTPAQLTRTSTRAYDPRASAHAPCSIDVPRLPFVTASWQVLATTVPTLGHSVEGNVLFSCARSWYSIRGSSEALSAAILVGARNPSANAPQLPGLTPSSTRGVFIEDGGASGPILARRVGRAWLLVQGPSPAQDIALLSALHVRGSALG